MVFSACRRVFDAVQAKKNRVIADAGFLLSLKILNGSQRIYKTSAIEIFILVALSLELVTC